MKFALAIALLTYVSFLSGYEVVAGLRNIQSRHEVMTIKTEYGDTYDCVDIHKQPSLNHPALKNHKIQLKPDVRIEDVLDPALNKASAAAADVVAETSKCPTGTVPIRRTTAKDNDMRINNESFVLGDGLLFAGIHTKADTVKGVKLATAKMSVWNPTVLNNQSSRAGISLISGQGFVQAGWTVNPKVYGDNRTRFYTLWTADNFRTAGCYSTHCAGFIVTSQDIALDHVFAKVSVYEEQIVDTVVRIWMDMKGNWWLQGDSIHAIGYWPKELFTSFGPDGASELQLGGAVYVVPNALMDSPPVMGTGDVIEDRYDQSAYFQEIVFNNSAEESIIPDDTTVDILASDVCYKADFSKYSDDGRMYNFLYGGPNMDGCQ